MSDVKEPVPVDSSESTTPPSMEVVVGAAKGDMMMAILGIQKQYNLPSYMTELILTSCLSDIRDVVNKDLILNLPK